MEYREWPPHPALRPLVRAYWALHGPTLPSCPQPVLPDGSSELVVHRGRPFHRHTAGRPRERQPPRLFVGQMRAPVVLEPDGQADVVGIRFRPHGAFVLLACPQHALADAIPDVDALGLGWLSAATRRARDAETAERALAVLEDALLARLRRRGAGGDPRVATAVALIEAAGGDVRVEAAAAEAGASRRHLERLFLDEVGVGPKVLARLARFQAAAARVVGQPSAPLAAVSGDTGYFDQSHMIRDFLAFSGSSPEDLRRRLGEMTAWMLASGPR
jgi:methylphosphotriester-DNA--protein-cysteine methyltransferase